MKKIIVFVAVLIFAIATNCYSETITWTNPTTYVDGTSIASSDRSNIVSTIYHKVPSATEWTKLTTVNIYAGTQWSGALPYNPGDSVEIAVTSTLYNLESAKVAVPYTLPVIAPSAPTLVIITR